MGNLDGNNRVKSRTHTLSHTYSINYFAPLRRRRLKLLLDGRVRMEL